MLTLLMNFQQPFSISVRAGAARDATSRQYKPRGEQTAKARTSFAHDCCPRESMEESITGYEPIKEFSDRQPKYENLDRKQTRERLTKPSSDCERTFVPEKRTGILGMPLVFKYLETPFGEASPN
jgi:hypothetical protein